MRPHSVIRLVTGECCETCCHFEMNAYRDHEPANCLHKHWRHFQEPRRQAEAGTVKLNVYDTGSDGAPRRMDYHDELFISDPIDRRTTT